MRPVTIDYQKGPRSAWAGWALLALPLLLGIDLAYTKLELEQQLAAWRQESSLTGAPGSPARNAKRDGASVAAELDEAAGVFRQLTLPWSSLFRSLEEAHSDEVALIAVQPDAQRRALTLVGEAKEYSEVLGYVARLRKEAEFANVYLVGTELKEDQPQRPMLFTVSANWRVAQ